MQIGAWIGQVFYEIGRRLSGSGKLAQDAFFKERIPYQINRGDVYINTEVPYNIYTSIPQVSIPIDKLAAMFANGVFKWQPTGSEELQDLPKGLHALLEKPNPLQAQNDLLKKWLKLKLVYGNSYLYKNQPSAISLPKGITCVSPAYITPKLTGKVFDQVDMDGIVEKYEYNEGGYVRTFETKDVLWSKIEDLDNPVLGVSPLLGLKFPISNTELAYKYLNVISGEKGNIGILSATPQKDGMGSLPMSPEDKKELEKTYRAENGIEDHQKKIMISTTPISWQPMTYETAKLLLLEQIDANQLTILDKFGANRNLFVSSTYENLKNALIMTQNDTIQPHADGFTQDLTKWLGLKGGRLVLDYSHLPYMQTNKKEDADTLKTISDSLTELVNAGIVSNEAAQAIMANTLKVGVKELEFKGNPLAKALSTLSPLVANKVLENFTPNETRGMVGLGNISGGDKLPTDTPPVTQ